MFRVSTMQGCVGLNWGKNSTSLTSSPAQPLKNKDLLLYSWRKVKQEYTCCMAKAGEGGREKRERERERMPHTFKQPDIMRIHLLSQGQHQGGGVQPFMRDLPL